VRCADRRANLSRVRARETPDRPIGHDGHSPVPLFADEHSEEQWEQYIDQRRRGITADIAARSIGLTATRMSRFLKREPERAQEAAEAAREGEQHYHERLRSAARVLALDTDNPNPRVLEVELATHVPGYEHLRRDRVKHEGRIEHGIVIDLDPGKLDALSVEKLQALREVLAELGGDVIDGEASEIRELPAA
jgi:hypothetical protein